MLKTMTKDNIDNDILFNVDYGVPIMSYGGLAHYLMFK
jgi:hypothetical protein